MNVEFLPRLLDDPQPQTSNLPSLPDVHIAPLRNPGPSRHTQTPLLLEPLTVSLDDHRHEPRNAGQVEEEQEKVPPPRLSPRDVLSAREGKKPHLAISELLETSSDAESQHLQLPSFVSLAVVEKSPIPEPTRLTPNKRLRLDLDTDVPARDVGRRLPRPAQKDEKQTRPVPLLPAMVTGLHEPPPSAGILPSMELDARPEPSRGAIASKMQVKDILTESKQASARLPPEAMINTPDLPNAELSKPHQDEAQSTDPSSSARQNEAPTASTPKKDQKARRARRKWSEQETDHLMAGVKKHGFGKWKQILNDPAFVFQDRTSIDLKDRYRVFSKDQGDLTDTSTHAVVQTQADSTVHETDRVQARDATTNTPTEPNDTIKGKRKRRPWTPGEDDALIRGVTKYGFQWTKIHDDTDLNLSHRRATDLRDRIRNLYPEGYRQAEVRPLKSEVQKADKTTRDPDAVSSESAGTKSPTNTDHPVASTSHAVAPEASANTEGRARSGRTKPRKRATEVSAVVEQTGVTLPSLALDDSGELDWGDNTLPPLIEWEEIGM